MLHRALRHLVVLPLALLGACEPASTSAEALPLVDPDAWAPTDLARDPEPTHRPDPVVCPDRPWHAENGGIEIDTTECNYVSLSQPAMAALQEGDTLRIGAWWSTLASTEPATGHFALYVGDELVWDEWIEIPGPAGVRTVELASPIDADAGAPVTVHVHNHGYNTWNLREVQVRSQIPGDP